MQGLCPQGILTSGNLAKTRRPNTALKSTLCKGKINTSEWNVDTVFPWLTAPLCRETEIPFANEKLEIVYEGREVWIYLTFTKKDNKLLKIQACVDLIWNKGTGPLIEIVLLWRFVSYVIKELMDHRA